MSIVIPNKDSLAVLRQCVDSILDKSTYDAYEIVIVENNSTEVERLPITKKVAKDSARAMRVLRRSLQLLEDHQPGRRSCERGSIASS